MLDLARMATSLATSSGVTPGTTPCPASWWLHGPTACDLLTVPRADGFLEPKIVGKKGGKDPLRNFLYKNDLQEDVSIILFAIFLGLLICE